MLQKMHITLMLWAIVVFNLVPCIPHHHHNGTVCMKRVELCSHNHDTANDEQGSHHGDNSTCIEDELFVIEETNSSEQQQIGFDNAETEILHPIHESPSIAVQKYTCFTNYHFFCSQEDICRLNSLRAPPVTLSIL